MSEDQADKKLYEVIARVVVATRRGLLGVEQSHRHLAQAELMNEVYSHLTPAHLDLTRRVANSEAAPEWLKLVLGADK